VLGEEWKSFLELSVIEASIYGDGTLIIQENHTIAIVSTPLRPPAILACKTHLPSDFICAYSICNWKLYTGLFCSSFCNIHFAGFRSDCATLVDQPRVTILQALIKWMASWHGLVPGMIFGAASPITSEGSW
jgi:hypothetical protein